MSTILEVLDFIDKIAPFETAMKWDNVGLLVGDKDAIVNGCVVALDVNRDVLEFAIEQQANLIITHHPVIFGGLKKLTTDNIIYKLVANNISVISAHTNLDLAEGGVNDSLAETLELLNIRPLENTGGLGRVGELEKEMLPNEFVQFVKKVLFAESINYTNFDKPIKTVAVVGGEGSDFAFSCPDADAYLSGELKHHVFIDAQNSEKQIFAVGHHESEVCVLEPFVKQINANFDDFKAQKYLFLSTCYI